MGAFTPLRAQEKRKFTVYGSIVYRDLSTSGSEDPYVTPEVAERYGIQPLSLVFEQRLLDVDKSHPHNSKVDVGKIDKVAMETLTTPHKLVSLDMESWNRFDTVGTPGLYLQVIREFRKLNSKSKLGLYAVVPQVTYGWKDEVPAKYGPLNAAYKSVAAAVDYFSPSLYNWERSMSDANWERAAKYSIQAAHGYDASKPVFPYVTPEVTRQGTTTFLTYGQMLFRLQTLKQLGADGCIIWTGTTQGRKAGGTFDPKNGWAKAVVDFQKHLIE
ncbi:MAG: hypothetical protein ABJC09_04085 [Terriglobia bacterium]